MFKNYYDFIINNYSKKTKIFFILTIISTIIFSISELISISILIPIISFLITPSLIYKIPVLNNFLLKYISFQNENDLRQLILFTAFFVIIINSILKNVLFKFSTRFSSHIGIVTSNLLVKKILTTKYEFIKNIDVDDYINLIGKNIEYYTYYIIVPLISLFSSFFQIILIISLLFYINFMITICALSLFIPLYLIINYNNKKKLLIISRILADSSPKIFQTIRNVLFGFKEIFLYSREDYYKDYFTQIFTNSFKAQSKSLYLASLPKFILEAIALFFILLILYIKINNSNDIISIIPFLTTFILALQRLLPNFQLAFTSYSSIKTYTFVFDNIIENFKKLDQNTQYELNGKTIDNGFIFNNIIFENVTFYYQENKNILNNINLEIKSGEKIFLYGNSGTGKSTFIDLFCGLISLKSGKIIINNKYFINNLINTWKTQIAYIPQKVHILNGSFYENITLTKQFNLENYNRAIDVAKQCGLHDIILDKSDEYNYHINSDFNNLSGGQLKRLAIARALFLNKSIIICDEATAGLDEKSEKEIVEMLVSLDANKTIIFISHNLFFKSYFDNNIFFK